MTRRPYPCQKPGCDETAVARSAYCYCREHSGPSRRSRALAYAVVTFVLAGAASVAPTQLVAYAAGGLGAAVGVAGVVDVRLRDALSGGRGFIEADLLALLGGGAIILVASVLAGGVASLNAALVVIVTASVALMVVTMIALLLAQRGVH